MSRSSGRQKAARAGYSGTPLAQKLGIKPGSRVALVSAPAGFEATLEGLPADVTIARNLRAKQPLDVVVLFCANAKAFRGGFAAGAEKLAPSGGLWVAWPKKASGVPTDLDENLIRSEGLLSGLVDNKVCAIDGTWSGLRFVRRVTDRGR